MPRLRIPFIKVFTDLAEKRGPNRLTSQRPHTSGQIEEVEQIKALTGSESPRHAFADGSLVFRPHTGRSKENILQLCGPRPSAATLSRKPCGLGVKYAGLLAVGVYHHSAFAKGYLIRPGRGGLNSSHCYHRQRLTFSPILGIYFPLSVADNLVPPWDGCQFSSVGRATLS